MRDLKSCLTDYSMPKLRALAEARGIQLTTNKHPEAVRQLATAMLDPDSIRDALEILGTDERRVLDAVLSEGGRMRADPFVRQYGGVGAIGDGRLMVEKPWLAPATPLERLWYLGLLFKGFAEYGGQPVEFYFVPTDLLPLLPAPDAQSGVVFEPVEAPEKSWSARGTSAVDLCTLLALAQNHEVRLSQGNHLAPKAVEAWRRRWVYVAPDPAPFPQYSKLRVQFLLRLLSRLSVAQKSRGWLRPSPDATRAWLGRTRPAQLQDMWEAWRADADWDELRLISEIHCEGTGWANDPVRTRRRFLELLLACQPGQWHSIAGALKAIRERAPDFQRTGGDYESWYIRDVQAGDYLMGFEHWDDIEGRLITLTLGGPMHWLGLVDLSRSSDGDLLFAITSVGHSLLNGTTPEQPQEIPPLEVTEDGGVHWPGDGDLFHRFQVERFADWRSDGDGTDYQITSGSLARLLTQNIKPETILGFLSRASGQPLPEGLESRLRAWACRRGRAELRRTMLLETDSAETLREIQSDPEIGRYLGQALSSTRAPVDEKHWRDVLRLLRQKGYVS